MSVTNRTWKPVWRHGLLATLLALALWVYPSGGRADDLGMGLGDEGGGALDILKDDLPGLTLEENPGQVSLEGLEDSALLMANDFAYVEPAAGRGRRGADTAPPAPTGGWRWKTNRDGSVSPLQEQPMTAHLAVPSAGTYRLYVRSLRAPDAPAPLTVTLRPVTVTVMPTAVAAPVEGQAAPPAAPPAITVQARGDGAVQTFPMGLKGLDSSMSGHDHERKRPLLFETEAEQLGTPERPAWVWEYVDVTLDAGTWELGVAAKAKAAVSVHSVVLSRAKGFRPSFSSFPEWSTLSNLYIRFSVRDAEPQLGSYSVNANLTYHWRGRSIPPSTEPIWGWHLGVGTTGADGWTPFIDATDAIIPGPGPWSTCNIGVEGVQSGTLEIEVAWRPEPAAVMQRLETGVGSGAARIRVPHHAAYGVDAAGAPGWGVWPAAHLAGYQPEEAIIERYFAWADAAMKTLGLPDDAPVPTKLIIYVGCRVMPANRRRAAEMLARLGANWIDGAPADVIERLGLHDGEKAWHTLDFEALAKQYKDRPDKLELVKMGDEIGTLTHASTINATPSMLAGFHQYLREQAALSGMSTVEYLGLADVSALRCIDTLPSNPGRYERRLYYASQRYGHLATVPTYRRAVEGFERLLPGTHAYNNYSPHPVFLTGATMNESDWFLLPRHQAQTMGWAEDWAWLGSWALHTRWQCTSFYAAIVECSVRKYNYPSGFYVGVNCGGAANKMFACVARGLQHLHLYDWGPIDGWAEGSNAWSEYEDQYLSVSTASHALGPADTIIADGQREPRRVAILYNRSHEIWRGGEGRLNHNWMWTYINLLSSQIPCELIIEEDLNAADLARYDVLFAGGDNLGRPELAAIRAWTEAGGTLITDAGGLRRDLGDDPLGEAVDGLFGARQRPVGRGVESVSLPPVGDRDAVSLAAAGQRMFVLDPLPDAGAETLASYADGSIAATRRQFGQGRAVLVGFPIGHLYYGNGKADGQLRTWLRDIVLAKLGRQRVEFGQPGVEVTLFEHAEGLAITLNKYPDGLPNEPTTLSVQANREITEVVSTLRGKLEWSRVGDRINVTVPPLNPVDVVILR